MAICFALHMKNTSEITTTALLDSMINIVLANKYIVYRRLYQKLENDCHSIFAPIKKRKGSTQTAIVRSQNSIIYYVFRR